MDFYIGTIELFAFPYTINGWFPCDGRLLPISQFQALFAVIGTQYGGNGTTNFALPDLRRSTPDNPDHKPDFTLKMQYYICWQGIFPSRE